MCVGRVCTHPSYNDKNPPSFFKSLLKSPFSNQAVLRFLSEWRSSAQPAPPIVDWQDRLTLDPPWVICPPLCRLEECLWLSDWVVLLLDVIMIIAVLLPTSEPLKMQRINVTFVFEGNAPMPDLPKFVYICAYHLWSSFIYRRSEYKVFFWICANRLS